jgi:hypothetical protein
VFGIEQHATSPTGGDAKCRPRDEDGQNAIKNRDGGNVRDIEIS